MPRARNDLVSLSQTPYYLITSRCVRRAFLCGEDTLSGKSYEHRRDWIEDRLRVLASLFSIDVCAYAVMSNHYHLVVRLNPAGAAALSDDQVLTRWTALYRGPLLVQQHCAGEALSSAERKTLAAMASVFRKRLGDLSWFMKCLNEPIARKANREDGCTGHFWEARFHSQALCSEQALIAAIAYVDLNPVRARLAHTPEDSDYTSIRARLQEHATRQQQLVVKMTGKPDITLPMQRLMPFTNDARDHAKDAVLPMHFADYLQLLDHTGRIMRIGKRGALDADLAPILERLGMTTDHWLRAAGDFRRQCRGGQLRIKTPV